MSKRNQPRILVVPVGSVDTGLVSMIGSDIGYIFNAKIDFAEELPVPKNCLNRFRRHYSAEMVARAVVQSLKTEEYDHVLAVADFDLYVQGLNFVFGIASLHLALVSVTRLRSEFYNFLPDQSLFSRRVLTEAVHELAHTYLLGHCHDPHCVMFFPIPSMKRTVKGLHSALTVQSCWQTGCPNDDRISYSGSMKGHLWQNIRSVAQPA